MAAEQTQKQKIDSKKYRMNKKMQERIMEETKPGTVLKNHPDYKAILAAVKKGE